MNEDYHSVMNSRYVENLRRYLALFPREQLHIVDGDALVRNPFPELVKIETFLGLEHKIRSEHIIFNEHKHFFCIKPRPGSGFTPCLGKGKGREHPEVSEENLAKLREYFRPHNEEFFQESGMRFNW